MRLYFDEVAVKGRRVWKENGKRRTQTVKFWQTENPFNRNADGSLRTRGEIYDIVGAQLAAWIAAAPEGEKREQCG